ncbi:MAG: hypothetical protein SGI88_02635 [Candidatus Hydrogenedentes bacterium]|nr:hypothetical protein [Candidatus Hydrogenedentota bacterium]
MRKLKQSKLIWYVIAVAMAVGLFAPAMIAFAGPGSGARLSLIDQCIGL